VSSSPLVVTCTIDYQSTLSALDPIDSWEGITLVNLSTGTPDEADEFERWAAERGAAYLEGNIFGFPRDIGSVTGMILYSGAPDIWARHEETLLVLAGASRHVADDLRTANVLILGFGAFFLPALGAFVEAATYVLTQGVSATLLAEVTVPTFGEAFPSAIEEAASAITTGEHETDQATLETYVEGGRSFLDQMRGAGQHARLLAATVENLEVADAAGLGKLGFYAQTKVARRGEST
jgi:3-hydroxyisobutyrate dehydrogenase-like beta-hydroxyacid dehydrogenase